MNADIILFDYSTVDATIYPRDADIILFDYSTISSTLPPRDADIIMFDYTLSANPAKRHVWNGSVWVRTPEYIWNGSAWQQIV